MRQLSLFGASNDVLAAWVLVASKYPSGLYVPIGWTHAKYKVFVAIQAVGTLFGLIRGMNLPFRDKIEAKQEDRGNQPQPKRSLDEGPSSSAFAGMRGKGARWRYLARTRSSEPLNFLICLDEYASFQASATGHATG